MTRLVDTATSADWDFLTYSYDDAEEARRDAVADIWGEAPYAAPEWHPSPEVMEAIERKTKWVAQNYEVSAGDLFQDVLLHLAVRPQRTDTLDIPLLAHRAEQVAIDLARPISSKQAREESLENILSGGADEWAA